MLPTFSVIFDMDGLMLDTERVVLAGCRLAAADLGRHVPDEVLFSTVGTTSEKTGEIFREWLGPSGDYAAFLSLWNRRADELFKRNGIELKPGLLPLLDLLESHGIAKAVATSTGRQNAIERLDLAGILNRFVTIVAGDEIQNGKPAPDIYLKAAAGLDAHPSRCFALEDSGPGICSAHAAGTLPILVPDLRRPADEIARLAYREFSSLVDVGQHFRTLLEDLANPGPFSGR